MVLYRIASEGHNKTKPHIWGHIMADVREKELCFQEHSNNIIKMLVSSFLSELCVFLGLKAAWSELSWVSV